jgi:hypothetical protein
MTITIERPCYHQVTDGNSVTPALPTCELAEGHTGPHHYICWAETSDGNADDPTFAFCKLTAFHAGQHEWSW